MAIHLRTIRGFQEELATKAPKDPRRVFGEAVEAASTSSAQQQLAHMFGDILAKALPEVVDKLTDNMDKRFARLQSRSGSCKHLAQTLSRINDHLLRQAESLAHIHARLKSEGSPSGKCARPI